MMRGAEDGSRFCRRAGRTIGVIDAMPPARGGNVAAHFGIRGSDIVHDLGPTIYDGDDVLEVVARPHVIATASMKRFQLGRDKQGRRDHLRGVSSDVECVGRFDRYRVPAVAEAQDVLVNWHDVDDQIVTAPSAERCARRGVLGESQRAQSFRERGVLRVGGDVDDRIDVSRGTDTARSRVGHEQTCRAATDEDQFVEHRRKQAHHGFEQRTIWISHGGASEVAR